jgi:hypothetical protein
MKISAYTILYYDLQFYEDIIKLIYDFVDEIIIIDGPYSYAIDTLKKFNLFYDESNKPEIMSNIIEKYSKVKYKYVICDNEEEKRMIGYNSCKNDLILLIDTDEFFNINIHKLNSFIQNKNKMVGCFDIYNMCDYNINYNKLVQKYVIFKKSHISALNHLDYLWLIGCKQNEKNVNYMEFSPNGIIYHQTLNRNKLNNIVKFIFYILLYRKNNNQEFNLIDNYDNYNLLKILKIDEILEIFIHSDLNRINIPSIKNDNNLEIVNDEFIRNIKKYSNNYADFYFLKEMKCLKNISVFFRLNKQDNEKKGLTIFFENVQSVNIQIFIINLNKKYSIKKYNYEEIINNEINIEYIEEIGIFYIININCSKTKNDSSIFTIKNIV